MATLPILKISNHHKMLFLSGLLLALAFLTYPLFFRTPLASSPVPTMVKPLGVSGKRAVMPVGYRQQAGFRDPFQLPKDPLQTTPAVAGSSDNASVAPQLPARFQFQLTGVAIGNGTSAAILESIAGSRTYQVGEYAGAYLVRTISIDSVTLVGPDGIHVLTVRR